VPAPETQTFFTTLCVSCGEDTVTEVEQPKDLAIVCNVCAPAYFQRLQSEQNALLAIDASPEAKVRMLDAAQRLNMPIEQYLNLFFAFRTGKPVNAIHFDKSLEKAFLNISICSFSTWSNSLLAI
jgi:hypothetical protein